MVRWFPYLVSKNENRDPNDVLVTGLSREEIAKSFIVRSENEGYAIFGTPEEALKEMVSIDRPHWHEVVPGFCQQRPKIDIDLTDSYLNKHHKEIAFELGLPPISATGDSPNLDPLLDELLGHEAPSADLDPLLDELLGGAETEPVCGSKRVSNRAPIADALAQYIADVYADEFCDVYDVFIDPENVAIATSSGVKPNGSYKHSYHIVFNGVAFADNLEAKEFNKRALSRLPPVIAAVVDAGVNENNQNFRLLGCSKSGDTRVKRALGPSDDPQPTEHDRKCSTEHDRKCSTEHDRKCSTEHDRKCSTEHFRRFIVRPEESDRVFKVLSGDPADQVEDMQDEEVQKVLGISADVVDGHRFREVSGDRILFDRVRPTMCRICGEVHHRDNTLVIKCVPEGDAQGIEHGVLELCRHSPKARKIGTVRFALPLRDEPKKAPVTRSEGEIGAMIDSIYAVENQPRADFRSGPQDHFRNAQERPAKRAGNVLQERAENGHGERAENRPQGGFQTHTYSEPQMREYENVPTLVVKAPMGIGKTQELARQLQIAHRAPNHKTIFVTFRQTFSKSLKEHFEGFELYSEVEGPLRPSDHPKLILQVESLYRLAIGNYPDPLDILVLDEVESILSQFSSGLHRNFAASWAVFEWLLRTSRRVICLDANISQRTFAVLANLRPEHPPLFHCNEFKRNEGDTMFLTGNIGTWLGSLHRVLKDNKRVIIASNSLREAKTCEEFVRKEFPRLVVRLYSSEMANSVKNEHFANVNKYWSECDVLIYTPTVSAGVSYTVARFDYMFAYFTDASCDVESSRQMLGRARNIATREYYVCIEASRKRLPTKPDRIRQHMYNRRTSLFQMLENDVTSTHLPFEYDPVTGAIRYYESSYFNLWIETVRLANLSRNDFMRRFSEQVIATGTRIMRMPEAGQAAIILAQHKAVGKEVQDRAYEAVASAAVITADEAATIRERFAMRNADVTPEDRASFERWTLCETYSWHGKAVSADWVSKYAPAAVRRIYKNLRRIHERPTVKESLTAIQISESAVYQMTDNANRELKDIQRHYVYHQHFIVVWFMALMGFTIADVGASRQQAAVVDRISTAEPGRLRKMAKMAGDEFEINYRTVNGERPETVVAFANKIMRKMYGVEVRLKKGLYTLGWDRTGKLFEVGGGPPDQGHMRVPIASNLAPAIRDRVNDFILDIAYDLEDGQG